MEKYEIIQMNHGVGEFSYAHNSHLIPGKLFTDKVKPILENMIEYQVLHNIIGEGKVLHVADLGCGMGPTPIIFIKTVHNICKKLKGEINEVVNEVQIYMSDVPSNDFNMIFKDVVKLQGLEKDCYVMGAPGSFYGRLFPTNSLHFVHSTAALHFLSRVPQGVRNREGKAMNKGSLLASETSTPDVVTSYFDQFERDFTSFLDCRSKEVVKNGAMLLSIPGRESIKPCSHFLFTHLFEALASLVSKGVITEEKLDLLDIPMYFPCKEEIEGIILKEGSFTIENLKLIIDDGGSEIKDNVIRSEALAKFVRSLIESVISNYFGAKIWNVLQNVLNQVILKHLDSKDPVYTHFYVIMVRKKLD